MEFRQSGENTVEVLLNRGELTALELLPENMDCQNPLTRRILVRLLQKSAKEIGFCVGEGEFVIGLSRTKEGATLTLTRTEDTQNKLQQVYRFGGSEEMITGSVCLCREFEGRLGKSSLYEMEGRFYLTLCPQKEDCDAVKGLLLEYGSKAQRDALAAGALQEHARCLIEDTALQTLSQYFS